MSKQFVFTLMPFDDSFNDIYQLGIKKTCEELDAYCERVDEQVFQGSILDRILNQISKADIVIADMTGRNPNVFFEVGYAKALNKKLIFLTSNADDIPFDLKHYAHIVYSKSIVKLKNKLSKQLSHYFAEPDKSIEELSLGVNLYIEGTPLVENSFTKIELPKNSSWVPLTIQNVSNKVFEPGDIKLGIVGRHFPQDFQTSKYVVMPDKMTMNIIEFDTSIFPDLVETVELANVPHPDVIESLKLKIYTRNGRHDFGIELACSK